MAEDLNFESTVSSPPHIAKQQGFKEMFAGCLDDGAIDARKLSNLLQLPVSNIKNGVEAYGLSWAGRKGAELALESEAFTALVPDFEGSIDWNVAKDVFVIGDNMECLKLLQSSYNDRVKMIYIDPPYNTEKDFVYKDDFKDTKRHYLEISGQSDSEGNKLVSNPEVSGRKHSNWLSMMYPRLHLARNVLTQDGVIFVSIDDIEHANLRHLMDEIFGPDNYISTFHWKKRSTGGQVANNAIIDQVEYILCYSRSKSQLRLSGVPNENEGAEKWRSFRKAGGQWEKRYRPKQHFPIFARADGRVSLEHFDGAEAVFPRDANSIDGFWENGLETARRRVADGEIRARLVRGKLSIEQLEVAGTTTNAGNFIDIPSTRGSAEIKSIFGEVVFENAKPTDLLLNLMHIANLGNDDIFLDFFAGSGSSAHAIHRYREETKLDPKFVVINVDEDCSPKSVAFKAGFRKVSEITLKRLEHLATNFGAGFRLFRLGASSFVRSFDQDSEALFTEKTLAQPVVAEALFHEVALKLGRTLEEDLSIDASKGLGSVGGLKMFLETENVEELISIDEEVTHVVMFEDSFIGKDSIKWKIKNLCRTQNLIFSSF